MKIEMKDLSGPQTHELLTSAISPLPIALISTVGEDGIYNAAPYSLTIPVSWKPPIVCVSFGLRGGQKKDTQRNIEFSQDFVINTMDETLIKPTIQTAASYPSNVDEMKKVGLTAIASEKVKAPRVAEAQVSLECQFVQKLEFGEGEDFRTVIFGEVVCVHVKDEVWVSGKINPSLLKAVGRLGNGIYCRAKDIFRLTPS